MFKVLTLNNIAQAGLARLPAHYYRIGDDIKDPDAILVRSDKKYKNKPRRIRRGYGIERRDWGSEGNCGNCGGR